jgi:hypothetical protein
MMDRGGGGKVFVEHDDGVSEARRIIMSKLIWIVVLMVVVILLSIIVYFVFFNNLWAGKVGTDSDEHLKELKRCLDGDVMDAECGRLFFDEKRCDDLRDLKGKCLFYTAFHNNDYSLCSIIDDAELKTRCENEVIISGAEF